MRSLLVTSLAMAFQATALGAQASHSGHHPTKPDSRDSAFAELQERGKRAMGVDQYTSRHLFDALPDGGRIELLRSIDDSAGVTRIRSHIRDIARAFAAGDFSTPAFVHMLSVPGTKAMAAKRDVIVYEPRDLPRGAELRIRTKDAEALRAIHEFMRFQRGDHRSGGKGDSSSSRALTGRG
jgi:hypothetical protein